MRKLTTRSLVAAALVFGASLAPIGSSTAEAATPKCYTAAPFTSTWFRQWNVQFRTVKICHDGARYTSWTRPANNVASESQGFSKCSLSSITAPSNMTRLRERATLFDGNSRVLVMSAICDLSGPLWGSFVTLRLFNQRYFELYDKDLSPKRQDWALKELARVERICYVENESECIQTRYPAVPPGTLTPVVAT